MRTMKMLWLLFIVCITMISISCAHINMSITQLEIPESSRKPIKPGEKVIGNVTVMFESVHSYRGTNNQKKISSETSQFELFVYEQSYEKLLAEAQKTHTENIDIRDISWRALRVDSKATGTIASINMTMTHNIRAYGTVISVDN